MSVDISKIRIGDRITVVLEVGEVDLSDKRWPISVKSSSVSARSGGSVCISPGGLVWVGSEDIATHEPAPRPIAIGDRVITTFSKQIATVRAIDDKDQQAWLQWSSRNYGTLPLASLELLEEGA